MLWTTFPSYKNAMTEIFLHNKHPNKHLQSIVVKVFQVMHIQI